MSQPANIIEQLALQATLPADDLVRLPRWALVTLAARCARRTQPLLLSDWPDAPLEFAEAIDNALSLTEKSAATGEVHPDLKDAAIAAGNAATRAANLTRRFASFTVTFAAVNAANVAGAENAENAVAFVQSTMDACHKSAMFASAKISAFKPERVGNICKILHEAMRHDFERLAGLTDELEWSAETPVAGDLLGALWPNGAPAGFPDK